METVTEENIGLMTMFLSKKVCDILELRKGNDMKKEEQRKTGQKETDNIALVKVSGEAFPGGDGAVQSRTYGRI